jgi:uncharacterized membrane protein
MKKILTGLVLASACLLTTNAANAHPGHGTTETGSNTVVHYLVEPIHFPLAVVFGLVLFAFLAFARKRISRSR